RLDEKKPNPAPTVARRGLPSHRSGPKSPLSGGNGRLTADFRTCTVSISLAAEIARVQDREIRRIEPLYLGLTADPPNGVNRSDRNGPENVKQASFMTLA
ncbi:MAG TPA: hypothetical protein VGH04_08535, partial [Gemmatimonadaceae bacterium]